MDELNNSVCRACRESPQNAVFLHCKTAHLGYCFNCASAENDGEENAKCPFCLEIIERVVLVI